MEGSTPRRQSGTSLLDDSQTIAINGPGATGPEEQTDGRIGLPASL